MPDKLILKTPAKINLSLDITGKRPDGYHTMRSVFQTVGIYDTLTFTKTAPDQPLLLTADVPWIPCDASNLVWKAAASLLGDNPCGVHIHLEKRIPAQAGMGGGSSDCAAALQGLRTLFDLPVSDEALHETAASLGADCAFFLYGGTCLAGGIGEQLTKLPSLPAYPLVIAKGSAGISTPEAYRRLDGLPQMPPEDTDNVLRNLEKDADSLFSVCGNHFDAITDLPEVETIRQIMRKNGLNPVLSGSGAAVFAGCADPARAENCAAALRAAGLPFVTVTETASEL
ncbi:MAG: 4-(cytidine 5'-diphospho)-2-C-methyl-D-erythritol kinase [Oscillospiraceae bacterium]|nr:4-(cytidine 5'-diphospho)-2-C-methyl-D-erythritol kinase [Oscillospiraceae bacterium]